MLNLLLPERQSQSSSIVHNILNEHLRTPGKLIRYHLSVNLGRLLKLDEKQIENICWASELIHNASLIHDDVVDSALLRRDRPTLNSFMSNSKAVLAGDYLLASVIAELVRLKQYDILKTLAETLEEIVSGEFEQDELKRKSQVNFEDLESVAIKKTGALIAWNCHSVAFSSGLDLESQEICKKIGIKLGLAFQLMDDNLDYSVLSGKEYAKDLKEGLLNFTTLNLIQLHPELYYSIYQIRGSQFETYPWSEDQIETAKLKTLERANELFDEISELLKQLVVKEKLPIESEEFINLLSFLKIVQERKR